MACVISESLTSSLTLFIFLFSTGSVWVSQKVDAKMDLDVQEIYEGKCCRRIKGRGRRSGWVEPSDSNTGLISIKEDR